MQTMAATATLATQLDSFATAYGVMSRLLLAPADRDLLSALADPALLAAWPLHHDADTIRGLDLLAASRSDGEEEAALIRDYDRLFVGPYRLLAPPYESVYRTEEGLLFEEPTFQVRAAYQAFGLAAPRLNREPDDHIGLEFSFLSQLCARALDALDAQDEFTLDTALAAQNAFLRDHLLVWGPACLRAAHQHGETAFYRGTAALGLGVLAQAEESFG